MSRRKFIFKGGGKELVLPVTPDSYQVEKGINVEVVNIHQLGDAILAGYGTLATIKVSCVFPASRYPFSDSSDPDGYIGRLEKWVKKRQKLRFVVGGTGVNIPAVIQSVSYGERDGTNDVYADIILREYRQLKAVKVADTGANSGRSEPESTGKQLPPLYGQGRGLPVRNRPEVPRGRVLPDGAEAGRLQLREPGPQHPLCWRDRQLPADAVRGCPGEYPNHGHEGDLRRDRPRAVGAVVGGLPTGGAVAGLFRRGLPGG